jgi:hypothetical protein
MWASLLGWRNLRRFCVSHQGVIHVSYGSGRLTECRLQINVQPPNQTTQYAAMVEAFPYRIRTPWFEFTLEPEEPRVIAEAERLKPFLNRELFAAEKGRRTVRRAHPDWVIPMSGGRT